VGGFFDIIKKGIWTENPVFKQLLGMCPLLAVTTSAINGFAIVYEVFQDEPCFYFAINTKSNGDAEPSTGDWTILPENLKDQSQLESISMVHMIWPDVYV